MSGSGGGVAEEEEELTVLCHNCGINPAVLVCVDCGRFGQHRQYSREEAQQAWGTDQVPYGYCRSCDIFVHQFVLKGHQKRFILDFLPSDRKKEESAALRQRLAKEPQHLEEPSFVEQLFAASWEGSAEDHPLGIGFPNDPHYDNGLVLTGFTLDPRGGDWRLYEKRFLHELERMAAQMDLHEDGPSPKGRSFPSPREQQHYESGHSSQASSAGSSPRVPSSHASVPPSPAGPYASPRAVKASRERQQVHQESGDIFGSSASNKQRFSPGRPARHFSFQPADPARVARRFPPSLPTKGSRDYNDTQGPIPKSNWVVPGHVLMGAFPGDDFDDLKSLLGAGFRTFVCLSADVEVDDEFSVYCRPPPSKSLHTTRPLPRQAYIADAQDVLAEECGPRESALLRLMHLPVYDCDVADDKVMMSFAQEVAAQAHAGRLVYIHGISGHGRSAVLSAILLGIFYGISPTEALQRIKDSHAVRQDVQREEAEAPSTHEQRMQVYRLLQSRELPAIREAARKAGERLLQESGFGEQQHQQQRHEPAAERHHPDVPPLDLQPRKQQQQQHHHQQQQQQQAPSAPSYSSPAPPKPQQERVSTAPRPYGMDSDTTFPSPSRQKAPPSSSAPRGPAVPRGPVVTEPRPYATVSSSASASSPASASGGGSSAQVTQQVANAFSNASGNSRSVFRSLDASNAGALLEDDFVKGAHEKMGLRAVPEDVLRGVFRQFCGSGKMAFFEYVKLLGAASE